jgi:hypothetical protein
MTTIPQAGLYQFTYPTFTDKAQWVYVHFITPDQQHAFVTYPHHPFQKSAAFVSVSWFETITMIPMDGYSPLMSFLESTLPGLLSPASPVLQPVEELFGRFQVYDMDMLLAA